MKFSFIYFDLDNTLLNHNLAETKAQQATYGKFESLQNVELQEWLDMYKEINHNLWVQYQNSEIDREQLQYLRFHDTMSRLNISVADSPAVGDFYMNQYRNHWTWVDGASEMLKNVCETHQVGIITNGFKETQTLKMEALSMYDYSRELIISEDLGVLKPHPDVFNFATEKAGVPREEILYVGDSYSSDIIGGYRAGWRTAWYTAFAEKKEGEDLADLEFSDFDKLVEWLE